MLCQLSYASNLMKPCGGSCDARRKAGKISAAYLEENSIPATGFPKAREGDEHAEFAHQSNPQIDKLRGVRRTDNRSESKRFDGVASERGSDSGGWSEGEGETAAEAALVLGEHQEGTVAEYIGAEA